MNNLFSEAKKINKKREFLAYNISGLGIKKDTLCKVFMRKDYISIYSMDKGLKLLRVFRNDDVSGVNMVPQKTVEKKQTKSLLKRLALGCANFGLNGGIFCAMNKLPIYRIVEKYNIRIKTKKESVVLRLKAA